VTYARCPHYPRRWVNNVLYNAVPFFDTALLWPWCRSAADRIMRQRPFDAVHANFLFPSGYIAMKLKQRYGVRMIVHERSVQRLALARQYRSRLALYRRILRAADIVLTENERMAADLREIEPTIGQLVVVKQPGCHPDLIEQQRRPRPVELAGKRVVLSVGALSERKGHEYLIRAVAQLKPAMPELVCRIIGGGSGRQRLERLIAELGLTGTVELCGKRPHAEVLGEMSWCDVFALPSWGEAGGTVYGEAMQFGTPILACEGEGIADIVRHDVHGVLVAARDADAVAGALRRLLTDEPYRRQIGERGRELALAELSYPRLAKHLISLYSSVRAPVAGYAPPLEDRVGVRPPGLTQ
jgi:glycosyltransferase involved in cell wall biosynthesis